MTTEDLDPPSFAPNPAGSWILVAWLAATIDPDVFADPFTFGITPQPNPPVGDVSAWHRCLGSHLARMELVTALTVWHERIPGYRIAADVELVYPAFRAPGSSSRSSGAEAARRSLVASGGVSASS